MNILQRICDFFIDKEHTRQRGLRLLRECEAQERVTSYNYRDGQITATFDHLETRRYNITPQFKNTWKDSVEFYLAMKHMPEHPDGYIVTIDGRDIAIREENNQDVLPRARLIYNTKGRQQFR